MTELDVSPPLIFPPCQAKRIHQDGVGVSQAMARLRPAESVESDSKRAKTAVTETVQADAPASALEVCILQLRDHHSRV